MMFKKIRKGAHRLVGAFCFLSTLAGIGLAQTGVLAISPAKPVASTTAVTAPKAEARPLWTELTASQQLALAPLQSEWSKIDSFRKKKWLQISSRFDSMKPDEQQRLQENMRVWAKLSPDERRHAREVYSRTKKLDAEQKSAQWQQYQQLPDTEKNKLATDIAAKKHVTNLPKATATPVIKPPSVLGVPVAKSPPSVAVPNALPAAVEAVPPSPAPAPAAALPGK